MIRPVSGTANTGFFLASPDCTHEKTTVNAAGVDAWSACGYNVSMSKTGRPIKSSSESKSETVKFRLDNREKQAFEDAARLAGIDLSAWIRERLRKSARRELEDAGLPISFIDRKFWE